MTKAQSQKIIDIVLVVGGMWHDIDFARLEILKLLSEDERVRTRVFESYDGAASAIAKAEHLVTYTSNVRAASETEEVLENFLKRGGRWYALHGTNAILNFVERDGARKIEAPRTMKKTMQLLGSQFIAHPPMDPYRVEIAAPEHPLVAGVEPFEATDELYLMEYHGELEVLLYTEYGGGAGNFLETDWPLQKHPVMYLHKVGKGEVLYFTLGHCRGHYDMRPNMDYYPKVERGSWELPVFYTLLRRGLTWLKGEAA